MKDQGCERQGWIWLKTGTGRQVILPTTCKTWACLSCLPGLQALFRARLQIGTSRLGRCAFITVTYAAKGREGQDADASGRVWRALLRRLKAHGNTPAAWLRVTELTKKKVPHHHLVVGPVNGKIACYGRDTFDVRIHRRRMPTCECLSHVWSRHQYAVTGDSYVVHATAVTGPTGAGDYMAKYLEKDHVARQDLVRQGFTRRWSSSRSWPGGGRLRLWQTDNGGWETRMWGPGGKSSLEYLSQMNDDSLLRRTGENLTLLLAQKRAGWRNFSRLERFANVKTNWA